MRDLSDIPLVRQERDIGDAPGDARIHAISLTEVRIRPGGLARAAPGRDGDRFQPIQCIVRDARESF